MTKIVAVVGATGAQGKGVVKAALKGGWTVRGLTRKPESDSAKELKALGAEVVVADINNPEDLARAFSGADAVFSVTNFYETGPEGEVKQGKSMIDVAKQQKVSHFIYSSLENAEKISGGKNKVLHFTTKAQIEDYLFASGLPGTVVQIACYYENWESWFLPKANAEGVYEFTLSVPGDSKIAVGSVADLGHVTAYILDHKDQFLGKKVAVAGDYVSPNEIAATFQKVWGKPVRANIVPEQVFAKFPFPHADELADMFSWFDKFGYFGEKVNGRDVWEGKKLYPEIQTLEQWVRATLPNPPK